MKTIHIIILSLITLSLSACGNDSLLGDAAGDSNPSLQGTLHLAITHHLSDETALPLTNNQKIGSNNLGFQLALEEAKISFKTLKLLSAGDDPDCEAGHDQVLNLDVTENLMAEDLKKSTLGDFLIPKIAYCRFEITLGGGASGSTFHLVMTWSKDGASGTLDLQSTEEVLISGVFMAEEDGAFIEHPLHFHANDSETEKVFGIEYDTLFQDVDFSTMTSPEMTSKILSNMSEALHQDIPSHGT